MLATIPSFELSPRQLARMTREDSVLSQVLEAVSNGEVHKLPKEQFSSCRKLKTELSAQEGCLVRGFRMETPTKARNYLLKLAPANHHIIVVMKACARRYFCWAGIDFCWAGRHNRPSFVSVEVESFLKKNGVVHVTSTPYHPTTNGQAERMAFETKRALAKNKDETFACRLAHFF